MKKIFLAAAGVLLILVGVAGLILPIMPGWPLIFMGASMIAPAAFFRWKYKKLYPFLKSDVVCFSEWDRHRVDAGVTTKFFRFFLKNTGELDDPGKRAKLVEELGRDRTMRLKKLVFSGRFAYLRQTHGAAVAVVEQGTCREPGFYPYPDTDGILTNDPGLTLLVLTADCLSVFLRAPGWVGLVHAGWRGSKEKIVQKAFRLIREKAGCEPAAVEAIFGPSICGKHYEVGPEFRSYFVAPGLRKMKERYHFDLVAENYKQLHDAGMPPENISVSGFCTISQNSHFYSFRKEKDHAGRMISFIQLRSS